MATLAAFLRERSNPSTWLSRTRKLHLFLGNEASDADSIISSICMAFLRQQAMPAETHFCAPWVQCRRGELKVRAETEALLRCAGIDPAWLVYKDDWQLPLDPHSSGEVALNLLDHNKLSQQGDHLHEWADEAVEAIWDHHPDLGCHKGAKVRDIAFDSDSMTGLGSCSTIVAEAFLSQAPHMLAARDPASVPAGDRPCSFAPGREVALLLLGVMLLDTACLSEAAGKAQPRDIAAANTAAAACGMAGGATGSDARALFSDLSGRKFSRELWASLSIAEAVGADFKQTDVETAWGTPLRVGYASVLAPLDLVLRSATPEECHEALSGVCADKGLNVLAILGFTLSGEPAVPHRELAIFAPEPGSGTSADSSATDSSAASPVGASVASAADDAALGRAVLPSAEEVLVAAAATLGAPLGGEAAADGDNAFDFTLTGGNGVGDKPCVSASCHGQMARWAQGDVRASRKQIRPPMDSGIAAWAATWERR